MGKLKGKVAVVTGASKGIGAAIAEELAREGAAVVVNYASSGKQAEELAAKIRGAGGTAKAVRADLSKPSEARSLVNSAIQEFGKVDILVNNAGVYDFKSLESVTEQHFDRMFDLNVRGLVFASQAAAGAFGNAGGTIINIGSIASEIAVPGASVYSATKGAVNVLTKTLAAELGPKHIRVNAVLPGPVVTEGTKALPEFEQGLAGWLPRTPLGRVGQPGDIAQVVSFLASSDSEWITGQTIQAGGGLN